MKTFIFFNKILNLMTLMSVIAILKIFTPSYALTSDLIESNESNNRGTKRQRESGSDSPQLNIKKQKLNTEDKSENVEANNSPISETQNPKDNAKSLKPISHDTFYIFNVGQGNSQLAVYTENLKEPFGVLYDCGSSAQVMNAKIFQTRSHSGFSSILTKKLNDDKEVERPVLSENNSNINFSLPKSVLSNNNESENKIVVLNNNSIEFEDDSTSEDTSGSQASSQGKRTNDGNKVKLKDVTKTISETIEEHKIKYLFVFLSHPDKDHFNLIPSAIPDGIKTLFILSGDFLQESDSGNGELKQDIQELFKFFKEREDSEFCLPYFWNFSKYSDIKKIIKDFNEENHKKLLQLSNESRKLVKEVPTSLYGSLLDLLNLINLQEVDSISTEQNSNKELEKISTSSSDSEHKTDIISSKLNSDNELKMIYMLSSDPEYKEALKNIYIWSLNKFSSEINNQSAIVSFKMPSLKKSFICTGDAHEDVFVDIYQLSRNQMIYEQDNRHHLDLSLRNENEIYTVLLVLPHHGSIENKSLRMLDLFKPDVMAISAGAGMHGHPSNDLVMEYRTHNTNIWNTYDTTKRNYHFLTFKEKGDKAFYYKEMSKPHCPILCTNVLGTIKITNDNFETEHDDQIVYNNSVYRADLSRADQVNIKEYKQCEDSPHIYVSKNDNNNIHNFILIAVEKKINNNISLKYYKAEKDKANDTDDKNS
ncbi:MAG: hypothetical protein BGO77_02285 [Caedibacter sp. 37-49]|nr:MAG: hypothetical protein BGO77_02285 [Caedibacter sp. 37-49]